MQKKIFNEQTMKHEMVEIPDQPVVDPKKEDETPDKKEEVKVEEKKEEVPPVKTDDPEKKEESKKEEPKKEEPKKEETPDEFASIGSHLSEHYGIKNKKELDETLESIKTLSETTKKLTEQAAKKSDPVFESDNEKAAYEFIKQAPKDFQSDRLITFGELHRIDTEKADAKSLLKQQFIIETPELTRAEAEHRFERQYKRKYEPNREKFDSDEEFEEAKKDAEIDLKMAKSKAQKFISKQQQEFKVQADKKPEQPKENEDVKRAIARNSRELDAHFSKLDKIEIEVGDGEKFIYSLNDDQRKQMRNALSYISNPNSYNEKGELEGFDPKANAQAAAVLLFNDKIIPEVWKQAKKTLAAAKIEDLAKLNPDRKVKDDAQQIDKPVKEEDTWDAQIKKKKERDAKQQKRNGVPV